MKQHTRARSRAMATVTAITALVVGLGGCGPDENDVPVATAPPAAAGAVAPDAPVAVTNPPEVITTGVVVPVYALDNTFRSPNTEAEVGDTVQFTNRGKNDHDVLPQEGDAWGVHIAGFHPGDVYEYVFTEPGVYPFYCSIHGTNQKGMVGTITVSA